MKFTLEELKDARGYASQSTSGLRIYPQGVLSCGTLTSCSEADCKRMQDTLLTGPALIAAIRERGGEVVGGEVQPPSTALAGLNPDAVGEVLTAADACLAEFDRCTIFNGSGTPFDDLRAALAKLRTAGEGK